MITGHGFGHASRSSAIAQALLENLTCDITIATNAPGWFIRTNITSKFEYRFIDLDPAITQSDSIEVDYEATLKRWYSLIANSEIIVQEEVQLLKENKFDMVMTDISPIACLAASVAGIPCVAVGNFGWDFIFSGMGGPFASIATFIADCYARSTVLLRLPFHEDMAAFQHIIDVGVCCAKAKPVPEELAVLRSAKPECKRILLSMGGLGVNGIPYNTMENHSDYLFIDFNEQAPTSNNLLNFRKNPSSSSRPVDLMSHCDILIAKPGYSTFAEAVTTGIAVVTFDRPRFAESAILIDTLKKYNNHLIIELENFLQGDWSFLNTPIHPPVSTEVLNLNGNHEVTEFIRKTFM